MKITPQISNKVSKMPGTCLVLEDERLVTKDDKAEPGSEEGLRINFLQDVATAAESALLLDFDGTLAPFRIDPSKVRPWAGVTELLDNIRQEGRTRLVVISGRPARDVALQLRLAKPPEIWGLHGTERLFPDGQLEMTALSSIQLEILKAARHVIEGTGLRVEDKWNAVVVHWRGKSPRAAEAAQTRTLQLLSPFSGEEGFHFLQFDGGIELHAGKDKGDAVRTLLGEFPKDAPVAYLGDDLTDEDAFQALAGRGLGVLVRRERRPSAANIWLRPPTELRKFLGAWLQAVRL